MKEIVQDGEKVLREIAKPVLESMFGSAELSQLIADMAEALDHYPEGVAIAAPQIGESLRMFVVNTEILALANRVKQVRGHKRLEDLVFINPEIVKISKKKHKVEEGCLSIRWLYGQVLRSEKVTIKAYDETGKPLQRGASGLLAQIFQHEIDHLDAILFIDKAENIQDLPPTKKVRFAFFGSSQFSSYVLEELKLMDFSPLLVINSAKDPLPMKELKEIDADVFVVASFGKILPKELIELPRYKSLNVHPSLLPQLRGPAPIQESILSLREPGVTIIKMDEKMDHGPILAQAKVSIDPWPDHYQVVEEKLGRAGGRILGSLLSEWVAGKIPERPQDESKSTYTKLIKKEDGLLDLGDPADENLRKVLAYSTWPGAYMIYSAKGGSASGGKRREIRLVVKDAEVKDGKFSPTRVIPAGKREMSWQDFLRGN